MTVKELTNGHECSNAVTYARSFNLNAHYRGVSLSSIPSGCYITDSGAMYFNSPGKWPTFDRQKKNDTTSICQHTASNIKKAPVNKNCQANEIITTEKRCKDATNKLGLLYQHRITRKAEEYPRGCFYGYKLARTWFNENVNGPTNPASFGELGGVCDSLSGVGTPCASDDDCLFGSCEIGHPDSCKMQDPYSSSTCFTVGGNVIGHKCQFPFIYNMWNDYPYDPASFLRWFPSEIKFESCTDFRNDGRLWCATKVTSDDRYIPGNWGECLDSSICRTGKVDMEPCVGACDYHRKMQWKRAMESSILR